MIASQEGGAGGPAASSRGAPPQPQPQPQPAAGAAARSTQKGPKKEGSGAQYKHVQTILNKLMEFTVTHKQCRVFACVQSGYSADIVLCLGHNLGPYYPKLKDAFTSACSEQAKREQVARLREELADLGDGALVAQLIDRLLELWVADGLLGPKLADMLRRSVQASERNAKASTLVKVGAPMKKNATAPTSTQRTEQATAGNDEVTSPLRPAPGAPAAHEQQQGTAGGAAARPSQAAPSGAAPPAPPSEAAAAPGQQQQQQPARGAPAPPSEAAAVPAQKLQQQQPSDPGVAAAHEQQHGTAGGAAAAAPSGAAPPAPLSEAAAAPAQQRQQQKRRRQDRDEGRPKRARRAPNRGADIVVYDACDGKQSGNDAEGGNAATGKRTVLEDLTDDQKAAVRASIERHHTERWDASAGKLRRSKKGELGFRDTVIADVSSRWPELTKLLPSDITNLKTSFWKETQGKLPHEVEAATAAAAQAAAAEAAAEAAAAALHGIPGARASWEEVATLMKAARADMAAGNLDAWLANGKLRAKAVDERCGVWLHAAAHTQEQRRLLSDFWVDFKAVFEK